VASQEHRERQKWLNVASICTDAQSCAPEVSTCDLSFASPTPVPLLHLVWWIFTGKTLVHFDLMQMLSGCLAAWLLLLLLACRC